MRNLRRFVILPFALFAAVGLSACSGSKDDDEKLAVDGAQAEAEGSSTNEVAALEPAPVATPEPAKEDPTTAPGTNATVDKKRVVRFVSGDQATIASEPKEGAAVVGKLVKGDRVLIVEQNGWGKIADGMFVNLKSLSNKGVPAERQPAQWTPPAH